VGFFVWQWQFKAHGFNGPAPVKVQNPPLNRAAERQANLVPPSIVHQDSRQHHPKVRHSIPAQSACHGTAVGVAFVTIFNVFFRDLNCHIPPFLCAEPTRLAPRPPVGCRPKTRLTFQPISNLSLLRSEESIEQLQQFILWRGGRADFVTPPLQITAEFRFRGPEQLGSRVGVLSLRDRSSFPKVPTRWFPSF
jgi:hypothetical protein